MAMFVVLIAICFCNTATPMRLHIIGGTDAIKNGYPYMLSVQNDPPRHSCGASLLRVRDGLQQSDIALTAAHCACRTIPTLPKWQNKSILAGNHNENQNDNYDPGEERRKITNAVCHPSSNLNLTFNYDLAVLKFTPPINFNEKMQPIDLPRQTDESKLGDHCLVTGWGYTEITYENEMPKAKLATVLQELRVDVVDGAECTRNSNGFVDSRMIICAKSNAGGTPCIYDSGGPLVCNLEDGRRVQQGIVSFGEAKCKPGSPMIYTRVGVYLDWIRDAMNEMTELKQ